MSAYHRLIKAANSAVARMKRNDSNASHAAAAAAACDQAAEACQEAGLQEEAARMERARLEAQGYHPWENDDVWWGIDDAYMPVEEGDTGMYRCV